MISPNAALLVTWTPTIATAGTQFFNGLTLTANTIDTLTATNAALAAANNLGLTVDFGTLTRNGGSLLAITNTAVTAPTVQTVLALSAVTAPGSTVLLTAGTGGTSNAGTATAFATVGNDWAALNTSKQIVAGIAGGIYAASNTAVSGNLQLTTGATTQSGAGTLNSVFFNMTAAATLTLNQPTTLTTGGVLAVGAFAATITGTAVNTLQPAANNDFVFISKTNAITVSADLLNSTSGTTNLTFSGIAGQNLNINGAAKYTGTTTILNGQFVIQNATAGYTLGTTAVVNTGGIFFFNNAQTYTMNATVVGTGALTVQAGATAILGGAMTYTGVTTIGNAAATSTLQTSAANVLSNVSALTLGGGGVLDLHGNNQNIASLASTSSNPIIESIGGAATLTVGNASVASINTYYFGTLIDGAGGQLSFAKAGLGSLTLTGLNTYSGSTTVTAGTLSVAATGSLGAGALTVTNPNTGAGTNVVLTLSNATQTVGSLNAGIAAGATIATPSSGFNTVQISLGSNTALTINQTAAGNFGGDITGASGSIVLSSSSNSILNLSGANYYGGNTTVNGGTLQAGIVGALPSTTNVIMATSVGSGTAALLDLNSFSQTIASLSGGAAGVAGNVTLGSATLTIIGSATTSYGAVISGTGGLTLGSGNTGLLTLTGPNTYTGATTINGGTLQVGGQPTAAGVLSNGASNTAVTLANVAGATFDLNNFNQTIASLAGGGTTGGNVTTGTITGGTLSIIGSAVTSYGGAISGLGGLTLAAGNTGTQTLTGVSAYTGATTVNAGTLQLVNGSASATQATLANTAVTVNTGGTLKVNSFGQTTATVNAGNTATSSAGAALSLNPGGAFTMVDGTIGTFNLIQGATFAGTALQIGGASGTAATLSFEVAATTIDTLNVTKAVSVGAVGSGGSIAITSLSTTTLASSYTFITASSGLGVNGLTLSTPTLSAGGHTYSTSLSNSTPTSEVLSLTQTSTLAAAYWFGGQSATWNTFNAGSTNWSSTQPSFTEAGVLPALSTNVFFNVTGAGNLSTTLGEDFTINSLSLLSSATSAVSIGAGNTLTIRASTDNGNVLGNGINLASGAGALTIGANVVLANAQTWTNNSSNLLSVTGTVNNSGNLLTLAGSGNTTISGVISGNGGLTMSGTGTQTLTNVNTYVGPTVVNAGTLTVSNTGSLGTGALTVSNPNIGVGTNVVLNLNQNQTVGSLSGSIATPTSGTNTAQINLNNGMTLTIVQSSSQSFAGAIAGNGSILIGAGSSATLTLTGQSTYLGSTDIDPGTIRLGVTNALPITTFLIVNTGATFDMNNFSQQVASLSDGGTIPGGSILTGGGGGGTLSINNTVSANATSFSGVISQNGGLTLMSTNVATLTLTGLNTYTGATSVQGGTLTVSNTGSLGTGPLAVANPNIGPGTDVILNLNNTSQTVGPLSGTIATPSSGMNTAQINLGTSTALTVNQTAAGTYAGVINGGTGSVTLGASSNNALTLTGQNTYGGGTTINGGMLVANNSGGSATGTGNVAVNNGGTLAGIGTIAPTGTNAVTVNNGGTIRGGFADSVNNYGTLSINANVTINTTNSTGGTIQTEVARTGMGSVAGSNSLIDLTGASAATFSMGAIGSPLGGGKLFTINVIDTTGSLLASDGSYTINLAKAGIATTVGSPTNFYLVNSGGITQLNAGQTIDSGNGLGAGGAGSYAQVTMTGATNFAPAVTSWTLNLDSTGQFMQLTLSTATPEPHHLLFACSVALGLVMLIRRRWRARCGIVN